MMHLSRNHAPRRAGFLLLACFGVRALAGQAAGVPAADSATNPPVPPAAELQKILATYEAYQALSPAGKAGTARPVFEYPELSRPAAEAWRNALWLTWLERQRNSPARPLAGLGFPNGWIKSGKVVLGCVETDFWRTPDTKTTVRMRYGVLPCGEAPATGWPVYFNLHSGGNNSGVNDEGWAATLWQYPIKQGLLVCPRAPVDSAGSWNDPRTVAALEKLLLHVRARWPVDPNRIYLMGYSMGAIGSFHIGPLMPDRWAAVAGSSGFTYLGAEGRAPPENLRNLPVMIQNGTEDLAFQRYAFAKAFAAALQELHRNDPDGYRVEFKEHRGKQHMINDKDTPAWLSQFTRDSRPRRIVWQQTLLPAPMGTDDLPKLLARDYAFQSFLRPRCYWMRNDAPGVFQRLVVSREGNTFRIEQACHVSQLTLLLDDRLADLDHPVVVSGGGRELARAKVPRTVNALVSSLMEYGDPELVFCAELPVKPPDTVAATLEGKALTNAVDLLLRAHHHQAEGRMVETYDDLDALVKLEPARGSSGCYKEMLALAGKMNDTARQVDIIRRWADADPANGPLQDKAARYLLDSPPPQRDVGAALRYAGRVVAIRPDSPGAYQVLAFAQQANGKTNEAAASICKAIGLLPAKGGEENKRKLEETLRLIERAGTNLLSEVMAAEEENRQPAGKPGDSVMDAR